MFDRLASVLKYITVALFATVVVITTAQVIARYVFNNSFVWAEELARYIFIWATMIATGLGIRSGAHLALSIVTDKLKPRAALVVFIVAQTIVISFLLVLIVYGLKIVLINFTITSSAMKIPLAIPYLGIPVGGMIILIFSVELILQNFRELREGGR